METTRPSLSIIIPVYNGERFMPQLFETLSTQGIFEPSCPFPVEIIMVDDGSTDGSAAAIQAFAATHPCVRYLYQENQGQASGRNRGIDNARMDYIYMMDQDDILVPNSLIPFTLKLHEDGTDVLRFKYQIVDECDLSKVRLNLHHNDNVITKECRGEVFITENNFLEYETPIWSSLYRRQFIEENNIRFDDRIRVIDDYVFNMECFLKDPRVSVTDTLGILWIQYPMSDYHNPDKYHIWNRRKTYPVLSERFLEFAINVTNPQIREYLIKEAYRYVLNYWFMAFMWMPESYDYFARKISLQESKGLLHPKIPFPLGIESIAGKQLVFKSLWFGMKHPVALKAISRLRSLIKIIIGK